MPDPLLYAAAALALLGTVAILARTTLKGWEGWLALKRAELDHAGPAPAGPPTAAARIEVADLKERVRKLEAIAAGVDL